MYEYEIKTINTIKYCYMLMLTIFLLVAECITAFAYDGIEKTTPVTEEVVITEAPEQIDPTQVAALVGPTVPAVTQEIIAEVPKQIGPTVGPLVKEPTIEETTVVEAENKPEPVPGPHPTEEVVVETPKQTNRWGITLNDEELHTLAKIVDLECGAESDLGQQAVIEVIFNRVVDPSFNNSVIGVLSEKCGKYAQFSTWKHRNKGKPDARVYANINAVVNGQTNVLPFKTVYFSRGAQNKRVQTRIGGHVFCNK